MTPIAGFVIAVIAGVLVKNSRRAAATVLLPWLVVLSYQSWYIASGRAVSPPNTVTDFPSAIGYWLVQAIILAPALGIAAQLGASGSRLQIRAIGAGARREWIASVLGLASAVLIVLLGFVWFKQQGGTVFVTHHSSGGSPPVIGVLGLLLSFVTCAGLGVATLRRRRVAQSGMPAKLGRDSATTVAHR